MKLSKVRGSNHSRLGRWSLRRELRMRGQLCLARRVRHKDAK
jgi:hypothetical protein